MKKPIHLFKIVVLLYSFNHPNIWGQITTMPHQEGFESHFTQSPKDCQKNECLVEFLPGWYANEVQQASRVYRDSIHSLSGIGSAGMIPTAQFSPEVIATLDFSSFHSLSVRFYASGFKNGSEKDSRSSLLTISYSVDGGMTYSNELVIDTFYHEKEVKYRLYSFGWEEVAGKDDIRVRWRASRNVSGTGQSARIFLDEMVFDPETISGIPSATPYNLKLLYENPHEWCFNKNLDAILYNLIGMPVKRIANTSKLEKRDIPPGIYVLKNIDGAWMKMQAE